jgi:uncharacterized SAM-binding protein YcdF (DUF218 family)
VPLLSTAETSLYGVDPAVAAASLGIGDTGGVTVQAETPPVAPPRRRSRSRGVVRWVLVGVLAVLVGLPMAAAATVVVQAQQDDRTSTDAIVVLGAAQFWGRPSPVLESRLAHASDLYDDGVSKRVITVGGKQPGDITTEGAAGKAWLVEDGVPRQRVVAVTTGSDTVTSLEAVADVMAERGWTSATIVTDPAHLARSLAIARALGIDAHGSPTVSGAGSSLTPEYVARETAGLLHFWLLGRLDVEPVVGS